MSRRREKAALLVAEDRLSDEEIAAQCGISRATLKRWKVRPEFAARVQEHRDLWAREIESEGIAVRANRVKALNDRWSRLQAVVEARAEHYGALLADAPKDATKPYHRPEWVAPGAETGALVYTRKTVGKLTTEEWAADVGLFKEIRAHEEQAAKELGQWTEKTDVSSGGKPVTFTIAIDRGDSDEG